MWVEIHHWRRCEGDASICILTCCAASCLLSHNAAHLSPPLRLHAPPLMCRRVQPLWSCSITFMATRWCTGGCIHYSINTLHIPSYESQSLSGCHYLPRRCALGYQGDQLSILMLPGRQTGICLLGFNIREGWMFSPVLKGSRVYAPPESKCRFTFLYF